MSLKPEIVLRWGDGEFLFRLNGKEIEELQKICGNVGFGAIYQRVARGEWFWNDIYNIIRLGLIGGGLGAVEAKQKTDMYCGREKATIPLLGANNPVDVAASVIGVAMHGFEDLPPGEAVTPET